MVAKESHCTTIREGELSVCGRYYIAEDDLSDELSRMIDELNRKKTPEGLKTSGEIFPSDIVPVLANSRKQDVHPFAGVDHRSRPAYLVIHIEMESG